MFALGYKRLRGVAYGCTSLNYVRQRLHEIAQGWHKVTNVSKGCMMLDKGCAEVALGYNWLHRVINGSTRLHTDCVGLHKIVHGSLNKVATGTGNIVLRTFRLFSSRYRGAGGWIKVGQRLQGDVRGLTLYMRCPAWLHKCCVQLHKGCTQLLTSWS